MSQTTLTHQALVDALHRYSPAIIASLSKASPSTKVHKRTLEKIRAGWHEASPWTLARLQPVLARLQRNETKEPK